MFVRVYIVSFATSLRQSLSNLVESVDIISLRVIYLVSATSIFFQSLFEIENQCLIHCAIYGLTNTRLFLLLRLRRRIVLVRRIGCIRTHEIYNLLRPCLALSQVFSKARRQLYLEACLIDLVYDIGSAGIFFHILKLVMFATGRLHFSFETRFLARCPKIFNEAFAFGKVVWWLWNSKLHFYRSSFFSPFLGHSFNQCSVPVWTWFSRTHFPTHHSNSAIENSSFRRIT